MEKTTHDLSDNFSWNNKKNIVVRSVRATAIYSDAEGNIVLRQQHELGEDDAVICIPTSLVEEVVTALRRSADVVRGK
jgi:hypothetical protein